MKFTTVINLVETQKGRKEIVKTLTSSIRNAQLDIIRDYFDGYQWNVGGRFGSESRTTRRGVEMWKPFDSKKRSKGFTDGELKTWNLEKPAIEIYKRYTRGVDDDDVKIVVDDIEYPELTKMFGDLNGFVIDSTERMSVDSAIITKFSPEEEGGAYKSMAIQTGDAVGGVEIIDAKTFEPLYWKGGVRGVIVFYMSTAGAIREALGEEVLSSVIDTKEKLYWELWTIEDSGSVSIVKFFGDEAITDVGVYEFDFLPFSIVNNSDSSVDVFDINSIGYSDVDDLLPLQDDMNKHLTTITRVFDNVAFPYLSLDPSFWEMTKGMPMDEIKKQIESISLVPGGIVSIPLNRHSAEGISPTQDAFMDRILTQFYMITGIPKSIFNSEGLSNTSGSAMQVMTESLRRKVSDKRTRITNLITQNVRIILESQGKTYKEIEVIFPDMIETTAQDKIAVLQASSSDGSLPAEYRAKKYLELMGDEDEAEEVLARISEEDAKMKADLEKAFSRSAQNKDEKAKTAEDAKLKELEAQISSIA